jgi:hypothetical protein
MRGPKKNHDEDVFLPEYNEESFAGGSRGQGLTLVHFSAQPEPFRTQIGP